MAEPDTLRCGMLDAATVGRLYRDILLREPEAGAADALCRALPDAEAAAAQLRASGEYTTVVEPLRQLLVREWVAWAGRVPTPAEQRAGVDAARGRCGSDDAVRAALSDGSIQHKLAFRPLKVEWDVTNQCNLRCVMCHFQLPAYHDAPRRHVTVAQFARIAEQLFPRAQQVSLSYGCEPLLHPDLPALLAILARHEVPHRYLNTNGLLLTERQAEAMVEHAFSVVMVSVDAATAPTYERIRVGGTWARLVSKLRLLADVKARRNSPLPRLGLGFVLMRQNLAELPAFIDFAAEVGAEAVNATHMAVWQGVGNEAMAAAHEQDGCNAALAAAHERATRHGIALVAPAPFTSAPADGGLVADPGRSARQHGLDPRLHRWARCPFPFAFLAIEPDGQVMPCGGWDKVGAGSMGNVFTTDVLAIWRGAAFAALRDRLLLHRLEGPCARCPAAGMGDPDAASAFVPLA